MPRPRCPPPDADPKARRLQIPHISLTLCTGSTCQRVGVCVFADSHASSPSARLVGANCPRSCVPAPGLVAGCLGSRMKPSFCPVWWRQTAVLRGAKSAKSRASRWLFPVAPRCDMVVSCPLFLSGPDLSGWNFLSFPALCLHVSSLNDGATA